MDIQEISDRLEIQDLLTRYCSIIDEQRFDDLRTIFTPDAQIDYSSSGGAKGTLDEIIQFLKDVMVLFSSTQHMISNIDLKLDGDTASCRCIGHNPMVWKEVPEGDDDLSFYGYWYVDTLMRTNDGWRIKTRREDMSYVFKGKRETA